MSRSKEDFKTLAPGVVKMYACGITVSADAHIGHAYQSVAFDVIARYLRYLGYDVKYVRNYTDVDDKIIANANALGVDPIVFAQKNIKQTDAEMEALGNENPTVMARATECIPDIIQFISRLIDKGSAYASEFGDVYFKLDSFGEYGKLSHVQSNMNEVGVRKSIEPGKLNDGDFALWKSAKTGEVAWKSPWGMGRPGWHIECSAMNLKYLGEQIDIHGGGRDLVFPHHENEIAQTETLTGKKFASYWIHCGLVKVNGQKMSKSLGNGILLKDVLAEYDADTIRFALLRNIYSADIDITDDFFPNAKKQVYKFYSAIDSVRDGSYPYADSKKTQDKIQEIVSDFENGMNDNFNTTCVIASAFKWFNFIMAEHAKAQTEYDLGQITRKIVNLFGVLNILQCDPREYLAKSKEKVLLNNNITAKDIQQAIEKRALAKAAKDWGTADAIRKDLLQKGIMLKDSPSGTVWDIEI